jgi:hypothetical protein
VSISNCRESIELFTYLRVLDPVKLPLQIPQRRLFVPGERTVKALPKKNGPLFREFSSLWKELSSSDSSIEDTDLGRLEVITGRHSCRGLAYSPKRFKCGTPHVLYIGKGAGWI